MKKNAWLLLVLVLALAVITAVPAFAVELVSVEVVGVPTLYIDEDGVPIYSEDGERLDPVAEGDIVLVGKQDFDEIEKEIEQKLYDSTDLPMLFLDKDRENEIVDVDEDSVSLIFDFFFEGDGSIVLDEDNGTAANLRFELIEEMNPGDLVIAQYIDGTWYILDPKFYHEENGLLDIMLENEGMLAFFRGKKVPTGGEEQTDIREGEGEGGEVIYRPSVTMREYPEPVPAEPGYYYVLETVYVQLYDADPTLKIPVTEITLRGAADFDEEEKAAYKALEEADKLSDVCRNLPDILKKDYPGVSEKKLVVRDIFDLSIGATTVEFLEEHEECCLALRFRYSVKEGDTFLVFQYRDGQWRAFPAEYVDVEDGFVTVKLRESGILAFVVEAP